MAVEDLKVLIAEIRFTTATGCLSAIFEDSRKKSAQRILNMCLEYQESEFVKHKSNDMLAEMQKYIDKMED